MTDVKRLLVCELTLLDMVSGQSVRAIPTDDVRRFLEDRLPAYEAAVEALERLEQAVAGGYYLLSDRAIADMEVRGKPETPLTQARAALARLRETVPA